MSVDSEATQALSSRFPMPRADMTVSAFKGDTGSGPIPCKAPRWRGLCVSGKSLSPEVDLLILTPRMEVAE